MDQEQPSTTESKKSPVVAIIVGIILVLVVIGGIVFTVGGSQDEEPRSADSANRTDENTTAAADECQDETGKPEATLVYNENEVFVPACIKISSGTMLIYRNESDFALDVGADPHPTHAGNREVSKQEFELPVQPNGGTASTVMEKTGTFGLHNHENASATATVIVE